MTIGKLVFRNITRRRGRLVFTLLGITIGIGSFVTFLALGGVASRTRYGARPRPCGPIWW